MSWNGNKQTSSGSPWPLLCLLLVALFLGHDGLMAAEAAVEPVPVAGIIQHGSAPHTASANALALQTHSPESGHPGNCRVGQVALLRSPDELDQADVGLAVATLVLAPDAPAAGDPRGAIWQEPHWSPATLRALFQVYRI